MCFYVLCVLVRVYFVLLCAVYFGEGVLCAVYFGEGVLWKPETRVVRMN